MWVAAGSINKECGVAGWSSGRWISVLWRKSELLSGGGSARRFWFFFFQAEDGIRGGHVTGVQTCALPICACPGQPYKGLRNRPVSYSVLARWTASFGILDKLLSPAMVIVRSEERRVGKECRCGWQPGR